MPYPVVNTFFDDDCCRPACTTTGRACSATDLTDGAIAAHLEYGATIPSMESGTLLFPIDGACHRVAPDATAFAYRDATFATGFGPVLEPRGQRGQHRLVPGVRRRAAAAFHGRRLCQLPAERRPGPVRTNYGGNYDRLVAVKRRYDPDNLFRLNHNIAP